MSRLVSWSAVVVARLYRAYFATLRVRLRLPDGSVVRLKEYPARAEVNAFCERDALVLVGAIADRHPTALIAHGRDGDRATAVVEALGCTVVRGSSSHGYAALVALIRELQAVTGPLCLVVDGPLGPAGQAKSGAIVCALRMGRPLRVLSTAARHALVFPRTWSGIYLPLPFTQVMIVMNDFHIPAVTDVAAIQSLTEALTAALAIARAEAIRLAVDPV